MASPEDHEQESAIPLVQHALVRRPGAELVGDFNSSPRLGCGYCFRTLDPDDPDAALRTAVRHGDKLYHELCWQRLATPSSAPVHPFTPPPPPPVRILSLVAEPLYQGLLNTLDDEPLGISDSVVVIRVSDMAEVMLRNNSDSPLRLDRRIMPVWAYLDYGKREEMIDAECWLEPDEVVVLHLYPHSIIPADETYHLTLNDFQGINLVSQNSSLMAIGVVVGFYLLLGWHGYALLELDTLLQHFDEVAFPYRLTPLITLALFFFGGCLLMPANALWGTHRTLHQLGQAQWLSPLVVPLVRQFQRHLVALFRLGQVRSAMQGWNAPVHLTLLLISLGSAIGISLPLQLALAFLPSILATLLGFLELGALLAALHYLGTPYGFNLIILGQTLLHLIQSLAQAASERTPG